MSFLREGRFNISVATDVACDLNVPNIDLVIQLETILQKMFLVLIPVNGYPFEADLYRWIKHDGYALSWVTMRCLNTKRDADEVSLVLTNSIASEALHSDISQHQRERTLNGFRQGKFTVLVATDVAARGLDIPNVDLVGDESYESYSAEKEGILSSIARRAKALERCEYWRLSDQKGKPPGVLGWWPSRAVTFIENHDTGSTQGHWRFPGGKEMQGYAYILTHPGTPSVFYDHIFSGYQPERAKLLSIRKRKKINCRSTVKIVKAERDVYAAIIDEKLAMKIGPGHFEPSDSHGQHKWSFVTEGGDYKIWEVEES